MDTLRFTRAFTDSLKQEGSRDIALKDSVLAFAYLNRLLAAVPEYFRSVTLRQVAGQASLDFALANGMFSASSAGPGSSTIGYLGFWVPDHDAFILTGYQVWNRKEKQVFADHILIDAIEGRNQYLGL